jgi:drug/metabolite transporter (DMT)-like permease
VPIVLALACALVYGIGDYCGGRAARVHPAAVVAAVGQGLSLVLVVLTVLIIGTPLAAAPDLALGAGAGAAGALALVSFYFALGHGAISVVAPTTAVIGAVVPVVAGLVQGERPHPLALVGIALAVACVALVSGAGDPDRGRTGATPPRVLVAACLSGVGFGALFVILAETSSASGLWPLVFARVASVPLLVLIIVGTKVRPGADRVALGVAVLAGVLDMGANVLYLAAARGGLLSIVAVISSLYPASTVGLAFVIDQERVSRLQAVGLGLAALALVLVTVGRS